MLTEEADGRYNISLSLSVSDTPILSFSLSDSQLPLSGAIDPQESPSARIVLGSVAKVGTGCFDIMLPLVTN